MKDIDLMNAFIQQSAGMDKPAKIDAGPITTNSFKSLEQPQRFSQSAAVSLEEEFAIATPIEEVFTIQESPEPVVAPEPEAVAEPEPEAEKRKFSNYGHYGDVPPGFRLGVACTNCYYYHCWKDYAGGEDSFCSKHDFPCASNYLCDDYLSRKEKYAELEEKEAQVSEIYESFSDNAPEKEVYADSSEEELVNDEVLTEEATCEYEDLTQRFSDQDLAKQVLSLTQSRFSKRSIYADAFFNLHYRSEFKRLNGTLEGAFVEEN